MIEVNFWQHPLYSQLPNERLYNTKYTKRNTTLPIENTLLSLWILILTVRHLLWVRRRYI